jgi:hypothetical protein
MKKLLALFGVVGLLVAGIAVAQVTLPAPSSMGTNDRVQVIPQGQPTTGNVYATLTQFRAWVFGGVSGHSGVPVLTSCGTGSPAVTGTDYAFHVTQGTSTTGCIATFSTAFSSTPTCVAVNQTAPGTSTPAYTVTTTAVTLVTASTSGEIWDVICVGN